MFCAEQSDATYKSGKIAINLSQVFDIQLFEKLLNFAPIPEQNLRWILHPAAGFFNDFYFTKLRAITILFKYAAGR